MQYVTSVERIGIEKGRQEGRQEGQQEGRQEEAQKNLLRLLQHRFDRVPEAVQQRLQQLTVEQIELLFDLALTVPTMSDFVTHIPANANSVAEEAQ